MGFKNLNIVFPVPKLGTAAFAAFAVYSCISCTSCSTVLPPASAAIPAGYVYGAYTLECPCTKIRYSCVCCSTAVSPVPPVVQLYLLHLLSFLQNTSMGLILLNIVVPVPNLGTVAFPALAVVQLYHLNLLYLL